MMSARRIPTRITAYAFTVLLVAFAQEPGSWQGYITDSECLKGHIRKRDPECIRRCIERGKRPILMVGDQAYFIANVPAVVKYYGDRVIINGNATKDTITVRTITLDAPPKDESHGRDGVVIADLAGTISDAKCAGAHADASEKSMKCVQGCVRGGQQPVLVADGKVFKIKDASAVMDHLGHKVSVSGFLNEGDTITITSVKMY